MHVAVIGAGIVGVATAVWLQRAGFSVTVIDRAGPAAGASRGNAGVLAAASIVPIPVPGLLAKAPRMLLDPDGPLFLRWRSLPGLAPFLRRYLGHARHHASVSDALSLLLHDTAEQHRALAAGTGAERFLGGGDYLFGYATRAAFEADRSAWDARRRRGHPFDVLHGDAVGEAEPLMEGRMAVLVRCPHHGHVSDPGAYVAALLAHVEGEGGRFVRAGVRGVTPEGVETDAGTVAADAVVLAAGVHSVPLARALGLRVPMAAERGYHVEFVRPSVMPRAPVMVAAGKFVLTPMEGRLRAAGIVEFGGAGDDRSRAPLKLLVRQTRRLLPELEWERIDEWMGHRPSTADSLPLIGALAPNVWAGFGHQHVGLTAGPKTGRWLAAMIAGERINADLAPFAPTRFLGHRHSKGDTR